MCALRVGLNAIFSGVTVDLNILGKFSISHIQLLDSRRLMWCDEANTVIQKTLGDGMDFYMYGGMDEVLERGKGSTDIRCSIVLSRRPTTSRDQSKLSIFSHDWSMLRVIINKTGLPKAQERRLYLTWTGDPKRLIQLESCATSQRNLSRLENRSFLEHFFTRVVGAFDCHGRSSSHRK